MGWLQLVLPDGQQPLIGLNLDPPMASGECLPGLPERSEAVVTW